MHSAGHFSFNVSRAQPYTNLNVFLQPFDWLEAGFRYTDISNRPYGAASLSGGQTYKDKSVDVKFRLWRESAYVPQIAVGLRDVGGNGAFFGRVCWWQTSAPAHSTGASAWAGVTSAAAAICAIH